MGESSKLFLGGGPCSLAVPVLAGFMGLCFLRFYVQELPKTQPAVVLVLKRLRRRGNGLKSHPTDWENFQNPQLLKSSLKTCSMPLNINNFKLKWSIENKSKKQ